MLLFRVFTVKTKLLHNSFAGFSWQDGADYSNVFAGRTDNNVPTHKKYLLFIAAFFADSIEALCWKESRGYPNQIWPGSHLIKFQVDPKEKKGII